MPKIATPKLIDITLPSSTDDDPAVVSIDLRLTARQALDLSETDKQSDAVIDLVVSAIKSWNFTDDSGNLVPVNRSAVESLLAEDFTAIANRLTESLDVTVNAKSVGEDEKKA